MSGSAISKEREQQEKKHFWISFMGNSPLASLDCIWLAHERDGFLPDKLIYFATATAKKQLESYKSLFKIFFERIDKKNHIDNSFIEVIDIKETAGLNELIELFIKKVKEYKKQGIVAVDVTPGRKIMSIAALEGAAQAKADKIYYLHLLDESYRNLLSPEIPCVLQTLYIIGPFGKTKFLECRKYDT